MTTSGAQRIERAIRDGAREAALVAFVAAGFPSREAFGDVLRAAGSAGARSLSWRGRARWRPERA